MDKKNEMKENGNEEEKNKEKSDEEKEDNEKRKKKKNKSYLIENYEIRIERRLKKVMEEKRLGKDWNKIKREDIRRGNLNGR